MSDQLAICLIAVAANLIGMLIIYSALSHALACVAWRDGGVFGAIALLVVAQLFWIAPDEGEDHMPPLAKRSQPIHSRRIFERARNAFRLLKKQNDRESGDDPIPKP